MGFLFKKAVLKLTVIGLMVLVAVKVSAIEVKGLYQAKVLVKDQTAKNQWSAILTGFKEVLVRKSGSQQVLSTQEVQQAYRKVKSYLQRYEYSANQNKVDQNQQSNLPFELLLDFEPRLVDELIQAAGMSIWGSNRPVSILWLVMEKDFKRQIINDSSDGAVYSKMLETEASRRGLPVILPLMDFDDELSVSISDIWGRFDQPIVSASQRYAADSIVFGRVRQLGELWEVNVNYLNQGEKQRIAFTEKSPALLFAALSNRLAELLCQKYCVVEVAERRQVIIQLSNINNYINFKQAEKYLENLSSIREVEVNKIGATVVRFNVSLLGALQSVKEGIELGKRMIEEAPFEPEQFRQVKKEKKTEASQSQLVDQFQSQEFESLGMQESGQVMADDSSAVIYYRWEE